jgi:hypothetical protein
LWRAIGANMLDCCGGLYISDIFEPNKRNFYYFNSVYIAQLEHKVNTPVLKGYYYFLLDHSIICLYKYRFIQTIGIGYYTRCVYVRPSE